MVETFDVTVPIQQHPIAEIFLMRVRLEVIVVLFEGEPKSVRSYLLR
jgi:hypothetical protein